MPLYEGMGLISEKHAVILDIGLAFSKIGYAGEPHPRVILQTPSNLLSSDVLLLFLRQIYFEHLLVNPKDRRVVLLESSIGDTRLRDIILHHLFHHYEVLSVLLLNSHSSVLFSTGIKNGLIFEIGYQEATVLPIYDGVPILKAWQSLPLGAESLLTQCGKTFSLSEKYNEIKKSLHYDILSRFIFVASKARADIVSQIGNVENKREVFASKVDNVLAPHIKYPLRGNEFLNIDGFDREFLTESLFEIDNESVSLATMIPDALLLCPIDTRHELSQNIIFVGGTTMIPGLKTRILRETESFLKFKKYDKLSIKSGFKVLRIPGKENYASWLGASIYGATEAISTNSLSRDSYFKDALVPDWANLRCNTIDDRRRS